MRVGIDGLLLWGCYSGVERSIARLAAALPAVDGGNEYAAYVPADADAEPLRAAGLRVHRAPFAGRRKLARILWQQAIFPGVLARAGVDALLAPGYVMPLRWSGPGVLVVYDVIALAHPELAQRANVWHYRLMLPASARRATRVAAPSAYVRDELVKLCRVAHEKVAVVPLGVDAAFRPVSDPGKLSGVRKRCGLPEQFLLYVGNLEPKKNLGRLLEAFALVRRMGLPHRLVMAGKPGWGASELQAALERSGVAADVLQPGFVAEEDLPALYTLADALVFPSLVEGFGLPPLEAMACGTPVVASDTPALAETLGESAVLVSPGSAEAIAEGIRRVLKGGDLRERLRKEGPRRAAQFTWERTARGIAGLLRAAADTRTVPE